jgi:hypothetical protein
MPQLTSCECVLPAAALVTVVGVLSLPHVRR